VAPRRKLLLVGPPGLAKAFVDTLAAHSCHPRHADRARQGTLTA
jgi:hypothetical protein